MNRDSNMFHGPFAVTAVSVYLLLIAGATTALTDATVVCSAQPACGDSFSLPATLDDRVALGHRIAAILAGLLVVAMLVSAWWTDTSRRMRATVIASVVLYPAQTGFGAVVATVGVGSALSTFHLALGMITFGDLITALVWTLEAATGDPGDAPAGVPSMSPPAGDDKRPSVPIDPAVRAKVTVNAYFWLTKPRLMWLLCSVASTATALAGTVSPGPTPEVTTTTLGGGALSIGVSDTSDHVLERDVDHRIQRTSDWPLAIDLVPVRNVVAFGLSLTVAPVALFTSVNQLAAVLDVVAITFHSVIYTLILKSNMIQNTVIGGVAGTLPAFIGWVAVAGGVGLGGVVLAVVIFMWTPAYFYNLALVYEDDCVRGGFPMMPVVRGETEMRKHTLWWLGATLITAAGLAVMDALGVVYLVMSILFGDAFPYFVVRLHYECDSTAALWAFHVLNAYLGVLLLAIIVDTLVI